MDNLFSWKNIRKIADLKFVKTSYSWVFIVPIFVKLFSLINEKVALLTIFEYKFNIALELPFTWQVFFCSSVLFMIGYFVYLFKAPNIIKAHGSWSDFKESGELSDHLYKYGDEILSWSGPIARAANKKVDSNDENDMRKLYWDIIGEANYKHTKSRWTCGLLFLLAFLLIAILVFQNVYTVLMFTLNA